MAEVTNKEGFYVEEYVIESLHQPITKEIKDKMYQMSDKVFYGEKLHVLDLSNIVDFFTFKVICYYRKELTICQQNNISIYELTENDKSNCQIDLYLELKKAGQVKII